MASVATQPTVLVPIAEGSEELEAVAIVDTLVRAGAAVTLAAVGSSTTVKCSRGVTLLADARLSDLRQVGAEFDCIALPGGMPGAQHCSDCQELVAMLKQHAKANKLLGAICAAPAVVLQPHGLCPAGAKVTCHPGFAAKLEQCSEDRVCVEGNLVTSRGPGTAVEFALTLVAKLFDEETAASVKGPMLVAPGL